MIAAVVVMCMRPRILNFPTHCLIAGFGVFAGRDFNKDDIVMWSWKTISFPRDMPQHLSPWYYVFGTNDTHVALPLGYGSVANHHEFANAANVYSDESYENVVFEVRELLHIPMSIFVRETNHIYPTYMPRPQGTSQLEKKFLCPMTTPGIGLTGTISSISPWMLHSPDGDQNSRRFRVANPLLKEPPTVTATSALLS